MSESSYDYFEQRHYDISGELAKRIDTGDTAQSLAQVLEDYYPREAESWSENMSYDEMLEHEANVLLMLFSYVRQGRSVDVWENGSADLSELLDLEELNQREINEAKQDVEAGYQVDNPGGAVVSRAGVFVTTQLFHFIRDFFVSSNDFEDMFRSRISFNQSESFADVFAVKRYSVMFGGGLVGIDAPRDPEEIFNLSRITLLGIGDQSENPSDHQRRDHLVILEALRRSGITQ